MANNIQESELMEFLFKLEEIERYQSLYDPSGFANDLLHIEEQHFELQNKVSFEPFVQSLRKRIVEYADSNEEFLSTNDKKLLHFLHTATLSKLCAIQNNSKHNSTVDLLQYLRAIECEIVRLDKAEKAVNINEYREKIQHSLNSKIDSANDLINNQIMPEIERMFNEIGKEIVKLIDEVMEKGQAVIEPQLRNALFKQKMMFWLKIIGGSLAILLAAAIAGFSIHAFGLFGKYFTILQYFKSGHT